MSDADFVFDCEVRSPISLKLIVYYRKAIQNK